MIRFQRLTIVSCFSLVLCGLSARDARAQTCAVPAQCTQLDAPVCNLGVCAPCETNHGTGLPFDCPSPATPYCHAEDSGSLGGSCTQCGPGAGNASLCDAQHPECLADGTCGCTQTSECSGGDVCDPGSRSCVPPPVDGGGTSDGSAAGDAAGGTSDGSAAGDAAGGASDGSAAGDAEGGASDGSVVDGSNADGGEGDATVSEDGSTDASSSPDGSADGAVIGDGSASGDDGGAGSDGSAGGPDAAADDGGANDGWYIEGGGCSCRAGAGGGEGDAGVLVLALALAGATILRGRGR